MIQRLLIWDIDNCISNDEHRMDYLPNVFRLYHGHRDPNAAPHTPAELITDKDFHEYHVRCPMDPFENYDIFFDSLVGAVPRLIFVTAMPQAYKSLRWWWLDYHIGARNQRFEILMRPDGDHRPSAELKVALLDRFFRTAYRDPSEVEMAFDDREDVLEAYEKAFNFPTRRVYINE